MGIKNIEIKITNKINMVDQPYKNILELRFIEGKKVYEVSVAIDRSYRYTKTLIKKAIKIEKGSGKPNKEKVAKITKEQVKAIAEQKMPDLNAASLEAAMSMIAGTARSMGVTVEE